MINAPLIAAIYIRVSTDEQVKGYSLDDQHDKSIQYLKSNSLISGEIYREEGKSGKSTERPELQRMLLDAEMKKFDVLIIYKIDRLSRRLKDFLAIVDKLDKLGIKIKSVTEPFDTSTPFGRCIMQMIASFAELEWNTIRERMVNGQIASMREGNWKGAAPYGYDLQDGKLVINGQEAEIVRKIYSTFLENNTPDKRMSTQKMQSIVNSWKIPTKRAGATYKRPKKNSECFWDPTYIYRVLTNPVYTGETFLNRMMKNPAKGARPKKIVRPKSEWIKFTSSAIVSKEEFDRVQRELKKNTELSPRKSNGHETMVNKLIRCTKCGRKYTFDKYKGSYDHVTYSCTGRHKWRTDHPCTAKAFIDWRLEEPLWNSIEAMLINPQVAYEYIEKASNQNGEKEKLEASLRAHRTTLASIAAKKERLVDLYQDGGISDKKFYFERLNTLNRQEEAARRDVELMDQKMAGLNEVRQRLGTVADRYERVKGNLKALTYAEKCRITKLLIDRVDTDGISAKAHCILPADVLHYHQRNQYHSFPY